MPHTELTFYANLPIAHTHWHARGTLPEQDVNDIVAFQNTLAGDYQGKSLANAQTATR